MDSGLQATTSTFVIAPFGFWLSVGVGASNHHIYLRLRPLNNQIYIQLKTVTHYVSIWLQATMSTYSIACLRDWVSGLNSGLQATLSKFIIVTNEIGLSGIFTYVSGFQATMSTCVIACWLGMGLRWILLSCLHMHPLVLAVRVGLGPSNHYVY